jgi:hypothetical protein
MARSRSEIESQLGDAAERMRQVRDAARAQRLGQEGEPSDAPRLPTGSPSVVSPFQIQPVRRN